MRECFFNKARDNMKSIKTNILGMCISSYLKIKCILSFILMPVTENDFFVVVKKAFVDFVSAVKSAAAMLCAVVWAILFYVLSQLGVFTRPITELIGAVSPFIYRTICRIRDFRISRVSMAAFCMTIVMLCGTAYFLNVGLSVSVNGNVVGYVKAQDDVNKVIREIENYSGQILNRPYLLDTDIEYSLGVINTDEIVSDNRMRAILSKDIDDIATLAVVSVDGQIMGALASYSSANDVLERIKVERKNGDDRAKVEFLQDVKIEITQTSTGNAITSDQLYDKLTAVSEGQRVYNAQPGDTLSKIATKHDMGLLEITELNPGIVPERLMIGDPVVVSAQKPFLSAKTIKNVTYTENIPYGTVSEKTSDMAKNSKKIVQNGIEGKASVTAQITEIDGKETERTITEQKVLRQPVDRIIKVGTKVVSGVGTGNMLKPYSGRLTSNYGYRGREFHTGIDLAGPSGSTVRASDNGRVVFAGWNGSYGKCVIINHGKGVETLYAHNSALNVSVGQVVEKGQKISEVGSTGRSTGKHVHFEVRKNGKHVNPWKYIG